jgi:hypothetical protein
VIADNRFTVVIDVDPPTDQMNAQATRMGCLPRVVGHLSAARRQPCGFRCALAAQRFPMEKATAMKYGLIVIKSDHMANEVEQFLLFGPHFPVQPTQLVVLTVRVVVATLRMPQLVAA